jgi:glutamate racemase
LQSHQNSPIGVFDSGFGGLTVLKELQKELPYEEFIYFGDTARLPYGTKSRDTIIKCTAQNCSFLADQGVKLIVIACNTATSMALDAVRSQFSIPILGVIDPIIETVAKTSPKGRIGILSTRATILSNVYQTKIEHYLPHAQITSIASQLLVSLVEEGFIDHPITHLAIQEYIRPLLRAEVDTVILACTHFPLLKELIIKALGPDIQVIDPAFSTALSVRKTLSDLSLLSEERNSSEPSYFVTDDPEKFQRLGPQFLGRVISYVALASFLNSSSVFSMVKVPE